MRALIVGPGIVGTVLAARLALVGHDVIVMGRGARLEHIRDRGLRLYDQRRGAYESVDVATTASVEGHEVDWIIVAVRSQQVDAVLEPLATLDAPVLTLVNQAAGLTAWQSVLGPRLVPGFPGISGAMHDGVVAYTIASGWVQPSTFGEVDGSRSQRVDGLLDALAAAGIPTRFGAAMDAWLRNHAGWIVAIMLGSLACHGDPGHLIRDRQLRDAMI